MNAHRLARVAAALALLTSACSSPGGSASATPPATATPTPSVKPLVAPRPTDIPTDGACERNQVCLGLLKPGVTYHTKNFAPAFSFSVQGPQWENIAMEGGIVQLLDITHPGDLIAFFRNPRAADENGTIANVGDSVQDLSAWLASYDKLETTPATKASLGGLSGMVLEARIADGVTNPGASSGASDCPARVCVSFFRGSDPNGKPPWNWDWGFAGKESARIFLLNSKEGVITVLVDALDPSSYDSLNHAADAIFKTVKFE
jgi:hypothetical protein